MVLGWQATADPSGELYKWDIPECLFAIVPKEWNYTPQEPREKDKCLYRQDKYKLFSYQAYFSYAYQTNQ